MLVPDHEFLRVGVHTDINILSSQRLLNVIPYVIKQYRPILAHLPDEMLPIDDAQPPIWVNHVWNTR